jgi:hypothetical protein
MAGERHKSWRELCIAALDAKDPDELLQILQELNRVVKHEEQVRHDFRHATKTVGLSESIGLPDVTSESHRTAPIKAKYPRSRPQTMRPIRSQHF